MEKKKASKILKLIFSSLLIISILINKTSTESDVKKLSENQIKDFKKKIQEQNPFNNIRFLNGDDKPPENPCSSSCQPYECQNQSYLCKICAGGYYPIATDGIPRQCFTSLGGYFLLNSYFYPCDVSCSQCDGDKESCNSCNSGAGYMKLSTTNFRTKCYKSYEGYFQNGSELSPCDSSCNNCQSNSTNCLTCNSNYFRKFEESFPAKCYISSSPPDGRCLLNNFWNTCHSGCDNVKGCSPQNCLLCNACKESYYPEEGKSFPTDCFNKRDGYFLSENVWKKCVTNCATCVTSADNCLTCSSQYYLKFGKSFPSKCYGIDMFQQAFYLEDNTWKDCDKNCKNCKDSAINCTACDSGKYLKYGTHNPNVCNESLDQYFLHTDNFLYPCDSSCDNCETNKLNCKACADNYFEKIETSFPTNCFKHPLDGWFLIEKKWKKCEETCSTCVTSPENCLICANKYFPKVGENYPTRCYLCDKSCIDCKDNNTNCTTCSQNYYPKVGNSFPTMCFDAIPKWFLSENVFKNCDVACANCVNSPENCSECETNFYRKISTNFNTNCFDKITGWFVKENLFETCDPSCFNCKTTKTTCVTCSTNYKFLEDKSNCFLPDKSPDGYYFNKDYNLHKLCDVSCYSCSSRNFCTKCANDYFPLIDQVDLCINKDLVSYTHPNTKVSYYYNAELKNYSKCGKSCKICKLKEDHCVLCNYEEQYFDLEDKRESCFNECPDYYFKNFLKRECSKCHESCKKCSDSSAKCQICAPDYFPLSDEIQKCYKELPNKFYVFDKEKKNWYRCPNPGLFCDEKFRFIECVNNYFLLEEEYKCLTKCPEGYWGDSSLKKCIKCTPPCLTCENKFTCKSCEKDFYFIEEFTEENCVKICPNGLFPNEEKKICGKCDIKCETCLSEKICLSCKDGFLHNPDTRECKETCDEGYIKFLDEKSCKKCDPSCRTCEGSEKHCTSCKDSFLISEKKICVNECPKGTYKDTVWKTCGFCHKTCLTCFGGREKECLSCDTENELKLIYGYCASGCPGAYIREKDGKDCIDFKNCFKSIFLSMPKIFSITDRDFESELIYIVDDSCSTYIKDFEFKWDEIKNAEVDGKNLMIPNDKLEDGQINLGILVTYNSLGITKLKGQSTLVTYKLIPNIDNEENLKTIYGYDIKIDASLSHDEGVKKNKQDPELKFKWICSEQLESFCMKIDTPILLIEFSEYKKLIKKPNNDLTFEFELTLLKDKRTVKKKVNFTLKKPIEIQNNSNNNDLDLDLTELMTISPSNSGGEKDITFILSFDIPSLKFTDYTYQWTIKSFRSDSQYLNTRNENNLKVYSNDLLIGINEIELKLVNKNKKNFVKIYKYNKPIPPYGGRCEVFPQNGISLKDELEFIISEWITNKKPLLYKIKFLDNEDNLVDISTGGFLEEKFVTKYLPIGNKYFLEVIDTAGLSHTIPCYLEILPNKNLLPLDDYLENITDPLKKMLIMNIYKSNSKANGGIENKESNVDPRIAINDQQIQLLYNLLTSGEDPSDNIEHVIISLLNVTPEPYSDNKIKVILDSFEIIVDHIDAIIKNEEKIKIIYEIGDNLSQRINDSKYIIDIEKKNEMTKKIQGFYTIINDKLFTNIISGQSLEIKTPAIDVKLTKASIINVPVVAMEYEDERKFDKFKRKRIKVRHLQNDKLECDLDFSAICLNKKKMEDLMNKSGTDKVGFKGELNKNVTLPIKETQFSNSINFYFTNENQGGRILTEEENTSEFELRLKLPRNEDIGELGPATCTQYIIKEEYKEPKFCISLYDLEAKELICQCKRQGLTVNVKDKALAQLSKMAQFKPLFIVGGFMLLFLVFYLIALLFDLRDYKTKKYQMLENYDYLQFYFNKYHKQGFYEKLNFFWFYIYLIKNLHPIWSILTIYHPGYSRKLRVMDYFLQIYLTFFFTFLRYYILGNPKAEKFIDDRSILNRGKTINSLSYTIDEQMYGVLYSIVASIITAGVTQLLQLWLYQDVTKNDLKRRTLMLKKNMLALDKDYIPLYKIKLRNVFYRIKGIYLLLPPVLRKYKDDLKIKEEKKCFTLGNIENNKNQNHNKIPNHNEYNSENLNLVAKNEISFCNKDNKDKDKKEKENLEIKSVIELKKEEASNFKKHLGSLINLDHEEIKIERKRTKIMNETILSKNQRSDNLSNYSSISRSVTSFLLNNDKNTNAKNDKVSINSIFAKEKDSKLDRENIIIPKDFIYDDYNSNRSFLSKMNEDKTNKDSLKTNLEDENSIFNEIVKYKKRESLAEEEKKKEEEKIKERKNQRTIKRFEFNYLSKKDYDYTKKLPKKNVEILQKNRPYTFAIKKNKNNFPICFSITIKKSTRHIINNNRFQNIMKTLVVMFLYSFLWCMMAVFINNLVEKYGESTFKMCIFPIFYMFLVKLIVVVNIQFFITALILFYKGKVYVNQQKRPIIDFILFKGLVSPMALDHYQSILHYQEYLRNSKYLDIN